MVWFILEEEEPKAEVINSNAEEQMGSPAGQGGGSSLGVSWAHCQNNLSLFCRTWKLLTSLSKTKRLLVVCRGALT